MRRGANPPFPKGKTAPPSGFWGLLRDSKRRRCGGCACKAAAPGQPRPRQAHGALFLRANSGPPKRPCRTVSGAWLLSKQERKTGFWGVADAKAGLPDGLRPAFSTCPKPVREGRNRQSGKARAGRRWRLACAGCALNAPWACPGCAPQAARFTLFLRANSRPQKRPCRTVFRVWLLSKRERKKLAFGTYPALERQTKRGLKRPLPCGLAGWAAIAAVAHEKAACKRAALAAGLRRLRLERALRAPRTHSEPRTRLGHAPDVLRKPRDSLFF